MNSMRVVALEEHFLVPELIDREFRAIGDGINWLSPELSDALSDLDQKRIADMDENGITQQIISTSMPGADLLDGSAAIRFAQSTNDRLAEAVRQNPARFGGFAHLPMRAPEAAADELERAVRQLDFCGAMVNGLTQGRFLDHSSFTPILERASYLKVPLYLHPNVPPQSVNDAYFSGLPGKSGPILAAAGFGWHSETAIHVLRLVLAGVFERFDQLTLIIGHMGEMLPFMLARADSALSRHGGLSAPVSETILKHVYITTSGFFTTPPFLNALMTFGADRIMFSVDYPYSANVSGADFLKTLPVSPADLRKIAFENADRVLGLSSYS